MWKSSFVKTENMENIIFIRENMKQYGQIKYAYLRLLLERKNIMSAI